MEGRTYLASDLAGELGLPRSTINDWLARYADYLEVESRGKRKAYSEKSLRILREISEMRNEGKSSFEIEQQLASRYGIRPEVTPHPEEGNAEESGEPGGAEPLVPATAAGGNPESALPVLRPAFEKMTGQINNEFAKLAGRLEEVERERRKLVHRMWVITAALIAGIAALILLLTLLVFQVYGRMERKNRESAEALAGQVGSLGEVQRRTAEEAGRKLGEVQQILDRSRADFQSNLSALQTQLAEQRKGFEAQLKMMESDAASRGEAQLLRLKEEFARNQQAELRKLVAEHEKKLQEALARGEESAEMRKNAEKSAATAREELARRQKELEELRERIKTLQENRAAREEQPKAAQP